MEREIDKEMVKRTRHPKTVTDKRRQGEEALFQFIKPTGVHCFELAEPKTFTGFSLVYFSAKYPFDR